jgi:hypothetical protein
MDEHSAAHETPIDSPPGTSYHGAGHNAALIPPAASEVINFENAQLKEKEGNMPQEPSRTPTPLELYRVYRSYVEHEDELINQRVQRLILSHGGLLSASALIVTRLTTENRCFFLGIIALIAVAGVVLGLLQRMAINAAFSAMDSLNGRWNTQREQDPYSSCKTLLPELVGGGADGAHEKANAAVKGLIYLVLIIWFLSLAGCLVFLVKNCPRNF